ncbi:hypothetical protein [Mammaliicoccus fleurettii]|uniref:hypothetical protein n=1 Tax=Mammaliicoccus fleurettii TaxID=150056 RepID=UPI002DB8EF4D|nr:hypothetical protein [Mammaliicoccus fleurettii]MEB7725124.1 hypothetical protein [Mammaliicoccus fleurettii]
MKFNKSIVIGIVIFLIFWLASLILGISWISYIGLAIFLVISFLDVFKNGSKEEIRTQIWLIILIIILQFIVFIF